MGFSSAKLICAIRIYLGLVVGVVGGNNILVIMYYEIMLRHAGMLKGMR